jgi:hypothetical protein
MIDKRIDRLDEYSISPESGRLRKRIRKKKKRFFSKRKVKTYIEYFLWIVILAAFVYSLIVVIPELGLTSAKKNPSRERSK